MVPEWLIEATNLNFLVTDNWSSIRNGISRTSEKQLTLRVSLMVLVPSFIYLFRATIKIVPQLVKLQSLTLSWRLLQTLQNHLLLPRSSSGFRKSVKDEEIELLKGRLMMLCLSSCADEMKQLLQVVVLTTEEEIIPSTIGEDPFNSSSKIWKISGTSCWLLILNGVPSFSTIFCWKALKKLEGSTGDDLFFKSDKFRVRALINGEIVPDCEECWFQKGVTTLRACRIELI